MIALIKQLLLAVLAKIVNVLRSSPRGTKVSLEDLLDAPPPSDENNDKP